MFSKSSAQPLATNVRSNDLVAHSAARSLQSAPENADRKWYRGNRTDQGQARVGEIRGYRTKKHSFGRVTALFGIGAIWGDECSDELMKRADRKLYEASLTVEID